MFKDVHPRNERLGQRCEGVGLELLDIDLEPKCVTEVAGYIQIRCQVTLLKLLVGITRSKTERRVPSRGAATLRDTC